MISFKRLLFLILSASVLFYGCGSDNSVRTDPIERALDQSRPAAATEVPDLTGDITDVRITAVERDFKEVIDPDYPNCTYLQIYYGYKKDGIWHDFPSENYQLKGTFSKWSVIGYEVAGREHVVQIGPFLIFSARETYALPGTEPMLFDTLGTEVIKPFEEYYTPEDLPADAPRYGYMKEDFQSVLSGDHINYTIYKDMGHFYYLIVNMNNLPEDYEVHEKYETKNGTVEEILTMEHIRMLLEYSGEE